MKKKIVVLFFVVAALLFVFGQVSFAQDMEGKIGLGARVAYVNYSGDEYNYPGYTIDVDFDDDVMYGANLTYFIHRYFSFELSVDYVETDVDLESFGIALNIGEMEQVPILLTARTHFSTNPKINPYLGIGVGYYLNDFDLSGLMLSVLPTGYELDPDDSFGFHINGGVEIFFDEHFAFNLDLKYIWNETDVQEKVPGYLTEEFSVDLDTFYAGVGFKYYF